MVGLVGKQFSGDLFREYSTVHFFRIVPKGSNGKLISVTFDQVLDETRHKPFFHTDVIVFVVVVAAAARDASELEKEYTTERKCRRLHEQM